MRIARNIFLGLFLLFFTVAVGGGLFWGNLNFVRRVPGGADFIVPWKAAQNFMLTGESPYGEKTSQDIQQIIDERPALPGQYPYRVNLPLNSLMLFFTLGWIRDLALARSIWMIVLETALVALVFISLRLARWKPHWLFLVFSLFFSFFWMPFVLALLAGNSIVLQALMLFGALRAIDLEADEMGGALAALALVNLEATGLVFVALLVWIVSMQRWRILYGFGMMLMIVLGFSFVLLPSWPLPFLGAMVGNWRAAALPTTASLLSGWFPGIGARLAQILAIGALTVLFLEWRAVRQQGVRWLVWTVSLTAVVTPLLGFPTIPAWLVLTLPGVLLVLSVMVQRWRLLGLGGAILVLAGIFFSLWAAQLSGMASAFILLYPLVLTILLYWVRWWAIRPARMWADEIALRG
jgi:uncharacterized integral membrane protein